MWGQGIILASFFERSKNMIEKIEKTLDVVIPFAVLVLSVFQLAGVIEIVDMAAPVIYGALAAAQAVFKIWGITVRGRRGARPE
jgi:hypothetical protein